MYDQHAAAICAQAQWAAPAGADETAAAWALAAWRDLINTRYQPLPEDLPLAAWLMARVHHHAAQQASEPARETVDAATEGMDTGSSAAVAADRRVVSDALPWHLWPVPPAAPPCATDALTAGEQQVQPFNAAAADALWTAAGRRLRQGLMRLTPPVRGVFLMHHGAGWSVPVIARAQATSPERIERQLHEAVSALRDHLGAHDAPPQDSC